MKISKVRKLGARIRRFGLLLATTFFFNLSLQANPIELPQRPVTPEITMLTTLAILLEALCVAFLLRRFRRPRFFILWVLGMHAVTFPAFLGLVWFLQEMRPALSVVLSESAVVIFEGAIICLICRFVLAAKSELPVPSLFRSCITSLVGNGCSVIAFPLLMSLYEFVFHT